MRLRRKIQIISSIFVTAILCVVILSSICINFYLKEFDKILSHNAYNHELSVLFDERVAMFAQYAEYNTKRDKEAYRLSSEKMKWQIEHIPSDTDWKSKRSVWIGRIQKSYETYCKKEKELWERERGSLDYINGLYQCYSAQKYIGQYIDELMKITIESGSIEYYEEIESFEVFQWILFIVALCAVIVTVLIVKACNAKLLRPMMEMSQEAKKIAKNDFSGKELQGRGKDEVSELVETFNRMKHSTQQNIINVREKFQMEQKINDMRLSILKEQMNPHFLFNTLNMITNMACLEDAVNTEKMIICLGNIFRYNLKTKSRLVPVDLEIKVVDDYMYIQQRRFGDRIRYSIEKVGDMSCVQIPAFTLQPLIENGIIHGLSEKEEGGEICIKIERLKAGIKIVVKDTGVGMNEEQLANVIREMKKDSAEVSSIGINNVYSRIHLLYKNPHIDIFSKQGDGTEIVIILPDKEQEGEVRQRV